MGQLHWTKPDFFDNVEMQVALLHAIARYHVFVPVPHLSACILMELTVSLPHGFVAISILCSHPLILLGTHTIDSFFPGLLEKISQW